MISIYKIAMASILVSIVTTITIVSITGDAVDLHTDRELVEMEGCPYIENGEHLVTVKGAVSALISGCGYIHYNSSNFVPQTYSLWFENMHRIGPHCTTHGREYFHFYCVSRPPSPSADIKKGRMFISKVWPYDEADKNTETHRCALYEKIDEDNNPTLRVAISKGTSCNGLSDMIQHPEVIPWDINGNLLMVFYTNISATDITSTKAKQLISKRYQGRGYIPQNFGNRSNTFHRKIRETKDDDKRIRRALQMTSDGDDIHGAVTVPTSKPVIKIAGANPFALLLANRVRNNNTGSIKPLGLWDSIVKIFKN